MRRVGVCVVLAGIAMMFVAAEARAASAAATQASARVNDWFEQLADADPAVRDEARVALMGLRREQLAALRHIVENSRPLAPAQAAVLRDIVIHVFLAGEPYSKNIKSGFMGVMMREDDMEPVNPPVDEAAPPKDEGVVGVVIDETIEGFSGNRHLRAGDIILGMIGNDFYPTPQSGDLGMRVQDITPGEPVTLQVLRQGKVIRVTFKLDARPMAAENGLAAMREFRNKRMERANEYWQQVFEPVIDPVTVPVKGNAPSNPLADT